MLADISSARPAAEKLPTSTTLTNVAMLVMRSIQCAPENAVQRDVACQTVRTKKQVHRSFGGLDPTPADRRELLLASPSFKPRDDHGAITIAFARILRNLFVAPNYHRVP